ncbi:MAG: thioesterase family protein [Gammaproteobacteria bacterium]
MNKLEMYQKIIHAFSHEVPFSKHMGLQVRYLDEKESVVELDMIPELIGNFNAGILHGGVIATLLDTAMGVLAISSAIAALPVDAPDEAVMQIVTRTATVDLRIDYLQPGRGTQFIGKASVVHVGKMLSTIEARIYSKEGVFIASGMGKFKIA